MAVQSEKELAPNQLRNFQEDNVADQHREWENAVLENGATNAQKHDLKIAFYSGAAAVFRIMLKVNEIDNIPDDFVGTKLNTLVDEVAQFLGFTSSDNTGPQH